MGICYCNKDDNNNINRNKNQINISAKIKRDKIINENCIIENQSNINIIKKIGQIKGESIKISSNNNCIILILDFSSSIQIQNCENCSFLLSPCSSSIQIRNCKKINVISAAAQTRFTNITYGNFFLYTSSPLAIESCSNICLGNFFVQYIELPELFHKSNLNIWNNRWSEYNEYGKNENIFYDNEENKNSVIELFSDIFNECFINYDQYQFLPYTYGKSINLIDNLFKNILIAFKAEDLCEEELLKQLSPDELEERKIKLISSLGTQEIKNYDKIIDKIKKSLKNEELIDFFNNKNNNYILSKNSGTLNLTKCTYGGKISSKLDEIDLTGTLGKESYRKFLKKGDILFLWFISESLAIEDFKSYMQLLYDQGIFGCITNDDVGSQENDFQEYLFNIFFK